MSSVDPQDGLLLLCPCFQNTDLMIQRKWYQGFLIYGFKMAKPTLRKGCVFLLVSGLYGTYEHGSYTAIFIFPSSVPIAFMSDIHRKIERERDVRWVSFGVVSGNIGLGDSFSRERGRRTSSP